MPYLTGGEIIAETLLRENIPYAVGIPRHGNLGLVDAFKRHEFPIIQVRHEQSACHLADGYCRVTGKPLAVFTSIGPGACNTVVGLADLSRVHKLLHFPVGWIKNKVLEDLQLDPRLSRRANHLIHLPNVHRGGF
ncbi:MAG: thiamine pyrophosphate-binding protein [Candidatus Freyrarchaeum guaymaensis]|nr:thiamine pyrophosphate-binding protein [Candidatus Sigynarchaeota archaeon]